ncbi:uncharacterized protein LOC130667721 isoform X2 [Microplitis mediator]|nr:uncharacterized protein LOC130667721 isoform X2 [Microplitis mediator]
MYYVIGNPQRPSIYTHADYSRYNFREKIPNNRVHDKCNKKRQTLVHKPEEEVWYEPYMSNLQQEYSDASLKCDSKVELPWKDIALPRDSLKIRPQVEIPAHDNQNLRMMGDNDNDSDKDQSLEKKESSGKMELPWNDLLVDNVIVEIRKSPELLAICDSTLEIPWDKIVLETPGRINPLPKAEKCIKEDIEIPWDDIMLPSNIIIKSKRRKHPSSSNTRRYYKVEAVDCRTLDSCCDPRCSKDKKIQKPSKEQNN